MPWSPPSPPKISEAIDEGRGNGVGEQGRRRVTSPLCLPFLASPLFSGYGLNLVQCIPQDIAIIVLEIDIINHIERGSIQLRSVNPRGREN